MAKAPGDSHVSAARDRATQALLDAAERLLVERGYGGLTTRAIAERAGVNQGLIHYYFGSMEELLLQVYERFTERLVARQRELYAGPEPFLDKWRTAMGLMREDFAAGYPKIGAELAAIAWNHEEMRARFRETLNLWCDVLEPPFREAMRAYGLDERQWPPRAIVALVASFTIGVYQQWHLGFDRGHDEMFAMFDQLIASLDRGAQGG